MIKNKDAIAQKSVDKFAVAKARMKAALDKSGSPCVKAQSNVTCITGTTNGPSVSPAGSNSPVTSGDV